MARRRLNIGILIACLLLGTVLWGYVTLTRQYEDDLEIQLTVKPPPNQALLSTVPGKLTVRVRASGLQIINLKYLTKGMSCVIDLTDMQTTDKSIYKVERIDLVRSISLPGSMRIVSVTPNQLSMSTGDMFTKNVPVDLRTNVSCRDGFVVVGEPIVEPPMVEVRGTQAVIESITEWHTRRLSIDDLHESTTASIAMSDSLMVLLSVAPNTVRVTFNIQQSAERVIRDVPVRVLTEDAGVVVEPSRITVTVRGGSEAAALLTSEDISAVVEGSKRGPIAPTIVAPSGFEVVGMSPSYVRVSERGR